MKTLFQTVFALIAAILIFLSHGCESDQNSTSISEWIELGGTNTSPLNDPIRSIASDASGNVYVTGDLFNNNSMRYVAKWSKITNSWSELGGTNTSSFNAGFMYPIATDVFGNVFTCGITRIPLHNDDFHVAKWDGSNWSELGGTIQPSFNNGLVSIATDASGNVYAAGHYIDEGNFINNKDFVARWDKSSNSWSTLIGTNPFKISNEAIPLTFDSSDNVYTVGFNANFSYCIAKWNGGNWIELGGTNSQNYGIAHISSITTDPAGNVYAALNDNWDLKSIAKWNKILNTWSFLDNITSSPYPYVHSITTDASGNVYAAGNFYNSDSKKCVAKWNGNEWSDFGNLDVNNTIYSINIDAVGNMYAGGGFTNDNHNRYVAVYYK